MFDIILWFLIGFVVGCAAVFFFARANKKKFLRYMMTDLEVLMKNSQEELRRATDVERAKVVVDEFKRKVEDLLKKVK